MSPHSLCFLHDGPQVRSGWQSDSLSSLCSELKLFIRSVKSVVTSSKSGSIIQEWPTLLQTRIVSSFVLLKPVHIMLSSYYTMKNFNI